MIYFYLFITFFQIGLFGFGGGYGMLSIIQGEVVHHWHWMNTAEFTDIVAISQMTPGPIGINSATYCGYTAVQNAGHGGLMAILGSFTGQYFWMILRVEVLRPQRSRISKSGSTETVSAHPGAYMLT